jgi:hypothetical protein
MVFNEFLKYPGISIWKSVSHQKEHSVYVLAFLVSKILAYK